MKRPSKNLQPVALATVPTVADTKKIMLDALLGLETGKADLEQLARAFIQAKDDVLDLECRNNSENTEAEKLEAVAKEAAFKADAARRIAHNVHSELLAMKDVVSEIEDEMRKKARRRT